VRTVAQPNDRRSGWSATSNSITLKNPDPSATLSKGKRTGVISSTASGNCTSGNCYYYVVNAHNMKKGSYTLNLYCNGNYQYSYTVDVPNGDFNFNSENNTNHPYCGFPNAWATFTGGPSPVQTAKVDFSG
jgi:hypothetical protein